MKGSISVEGALVFPIFLYGIFSILFLIKVIFIHEQVQFTLSQIANEMAVSAYILEKSELIDLQQEIYSEAKGTKENFEMGISGIQNEIEHISNLSFGLDYSQFETINVQFNETYNDGELLNESSSTKLENIMLALNQNKNNLSEFVSNTFNAVINLMASFEIVAESSTGIIGAFGGVEGIEYINNQISSEISKARFNDIISEENYLQWGIIGGAEGIDFSRTEFMLENDDIVIVVYYEIKFPFQGFFMDKIAMKQRVRVRAFTGNGNFLSHYERKEEEVKGNCQIVYITKSGTKYHTERDCKYIRIPIQSYLYEEIADERHICEICNKDDLRNYTVVYGTKDSDIFHTSKSCYTINREVYSIEISEAIKRGYTMCSNCKGGDNN